MLMTHVGCVRVVGLKQIAWSNDVSMTLGFKLVESFSLPLLATVDCCMCHKENFLLQQVCSNVGTVPRGLKLE